MLAHEPYLVVAALATIAMVPLLLRACAERLIHARLVMLTVIMAGAGIAVLLVAHVVIAPPWSETGRFLAGIVTGFVMGLLLGAAAILFVDRRYHSTRYLNH